MLRQVISGYKTYVFCAALLMNAVYTMYTGQAPPTFENPAGGLDPTTTALLAGTIASLRAGVSKVIEGVAEVRKNL